MASTVKPRITSRVVLANSFQYKTVYKFLFSANTGKGLRDLEKIHSEDRKIIHDFFVTQKGTPVIEEFLSCIGNQRFFVIQVWHGSRSGSIPLDELEKLWG